jgi:hypothetical protein
LTAEENAKKGSKILEEHKHLLSFLSTVPKLRGENHSRPREKLGYGKILMDEGTTNVPEMGNPQPISYGRYAKTMEKVQRS